MASDLVDSLTLDRDYKEAFELVPGAPSPPLLQVGQNDLLMSLCGCLSTPFWFVLRKLRHQHWRDWDSIVESREEDIRNELYSLFQSDRILTAGRRIRIRSGGRDVTDIDAAAFDRQHGTLLLFQLKWQDPFGHSMRERRSRMRNLVSTGNQWAESVGEWIERSSHEQLLAWAGKDLVDGRINRIELVVLVRHHARFTGSGSRTDKAIWGTWPQLCRIAHEKYVGGDLLGLLANEMRDEQTRTDSSRQVESGRMSIGGVEIVVSATHDSA